MKQKIIIMSVTLFIAQLVCQFAYAQENVVLQENEIPGMIINRPIRIHHWPVTGTAKTSMECVEQHGTIQGMNLFILYAEFGNTNEAHQAVEFYSRSHQTVFYPGLWNGATNEFLGDESWHTEESFGDAILFRSGRICVLVDCDTINVSGEKQKENRQQVVKLLQKPIEDKIKRGGRVILSYEDGHTLAAQVTLKPEVLEVNPGILTAFVRLPDGYPVTNIISATCDRAPAERMMPNDDGTEMIIKFRRQDIEAALAQWGGIFDTYFVVRGVWKGGTRTLRFHGVDSIKKIVGAKEKKK